MRACSRCGKNRNERFYAPRGKVCFTCQRKRRRVTSKGARLVSTYDITQVEYDAILATQGGVCAGCSQTRSYNLHVDHDHHVEREHGTRRSIRGLLCARCNKLLRDCRDSASNLRQLAAYLDNPPAKDIL